MNIDGKVNVKERIEIFDSDYFTTYLYKFENGNKYPDTVPKWIRTDFKNSTIYNVEDRLSKKGKDYVQCVEKVKKKVNFIIVKS